MTFRDSVKQWLNPPFDEATINHVRTLQENVEELEDSKIFKPGLDGDQVTVYPVAPPESSNSIASISP